VNGGDTACVGVRLGGTEEPLGLRLVGGESPEHRLGRFLDDDARGLAALPSDAGLGQVAAEPIERRRVERDDVDVLSDGDDRAVDGHGVQIGAGERGGLPPRRLVVAEAEDRVARWDRVRTTAECVECVVPTRCRREVGVDAFPADEFEVGVGVDEAGEQDATVQVDSPGVDAVEEREVGRVADAVDPTVPDGDRLVDPIGTGKRVDLGVRQEEVCGRGHAGEAGGSAVTFAWDPERDVPRRLRAGRHSHGRCRPPGRLDHAGAVVYGA
jgi:hypothetical protein